MATQNFTLYDIIVDTIPGFFGLGMVLFLMPKSFTDGLIGASESLALGFVLIAVAYVFGRAVHAISGCTSNLLEKTLAHRVLKIEREADVEGESRRVRSILLLQFRKILPIEQGDFLIDLLLDKSQQLPSLAEKVNDDDDSDDNMSKRSTFLQTDQTIQLIANRVEVQFIDSHDFPLNNPSEFIRHFGFAELYSTSHLYQRYNLLTTFFRNMSFLLWLFPFAAFIQYIFYSADILINEEPYWLSLDISVHILIFSTILGVVFGREVFKYSNKRNLYFLIDYYRELEAK